MVRANIPDGFDLLLTHFELSNAEIEALDSQGADDAIICDLFVNYGLRVSEVAKLTKTTKGTVLQTLLRWEIIRDRRPSEDRRHNAVEHFSSGYGSPW